jgi:hypothetical protein
LSWPVPYHSQRLSLPYHSNISHKVYNNVFTAQIWNNVFGGHCCKLPSIRVFFGMKKAVKSEIDLGISLMVRDHVYKFQMIWLREI